MGKDSNHRYSPPKGCVTEGRVGSASPAKLVPLCGKVKCSVSHWKRAWLLRKVVGGGGRYLLFEPKFVYAFYMKQILHKVLMQSCWPGPNPLFQAFMQASNCKAKNLSFAFQRNENFDYFTPSRTLQQETANSLWTRHLSASCEPGLLRQKRTLNPTSLILLSTPQLCDTYSLFLLAACVAEWEWVLPLKERLWAVKQAWREASLHGTD